MRQNCVLPALFLSGLQPLIVEPFSNLATCTKGRGEWTQRIHLTALPLCLGWPVTGCLDPGKKYISVVRLHGSMNNQEALLQNHVIFPNFDKEAT